MTDDASTSEYVTLVSSDGYQFVVRRSAACVSGALKRMLDPKSNFSEAIENKATLENLNGVVLEKVCEYFYFYEKHRDSRDAPDMEFPPELCLELLMAADYLNSELLRAPSSKLVDGLDDLTHILQHDISGAYKQYGPNRWFTDLQTSVHSRDARYCKTSSSHPT
ncbi:MAG: hypothetical protein M1839_003387 [Geoglossum umbratile]|nr:MAG: hypothetical protein M1839_003387 [Geoglossum umbratile]